MTLSNCYNELNGRKSWNGVFANIILYVINDIAYFLFKLR
jgi:hypothetical protein